MNQMLPEPSAQVLDALDRGNKIGAIKPYREQTGLGLREAKDVIDRITSTMPAGGSGDVVTRTFKGDQASLAHQLDEDFRAMSSQGYVVEGQIPKQGHKSLFNRNPQDSVTVTYRRQSARPATAPRPSGSREQDRYDQLEHIGRLKEQGILSEEEFEREKHRILGY